MRGFAGSQILAGTDEVADSLALHDAVLGGLRRSGGGSGGRGWTAAVWAEMDGGDGGQGWTTARCTGGGVGWVDLQWC
jgi:hypothetical protein